MRKLILASLLGLLVLASSAAQAGEIYFNAAGAESLATASCAPTNNVSSDTAGVGDPSFVTRDCSGTANQGFAWHFIYPTDAAASGTPFTAYLYYLNSGTGTNGIVWTVEICCAANAAEYDNIVCGTALTSGAITPNNSATTIKISNLGTPALPAGVATNAACALKVSRPSSSDGNDTNTAVIRAAAGRLQY